MIEVIIKVQPNFYAMITEYYTSRVNYNALMNRVKKDAGYNFITQLKEDKSIP
jgi:hypothetical protein